MERKQDTVSAEDLGELAQRAVGETIDTMRAAATATNSQERTKQMRRANGYFRAAHRLDQRSKERRNRIKINK